MVAILRIRGDELVETPKIDQKLRKDAKPIKQVPLIKLVELNSKWVTKQSHQEETSVMLMIVMLLIRVDLVVCLLQKKQQKGEKSIWQQEV